MSLYTKIQFCLSKRTQKRLAEYLNKNSGLSIAYLLNLVLNQKTEGINTKLTSSSCDIKNTYSVNIFKKDLILINSLAAQSFTYDQVIDTLISSYLDNPIKISSSSSSYCEKDIDSFLEENLELFQRLSEK